MLAKITKKKYMLNLFVPFCSVRSTHVSFARKVRRRKLFSVGVTILCLKQVQTGR